MREDSGALCDLSDTTHEVFGPYSTCTFVFKAGLAIRDPYMEHLELWRLGFAPNKLSDNAPMETVAVNVWLSIQSNLPGSWDVDNLAQQSVWHIILKRFLFPGLYSDPNRQLSQINTIPMSSAWIRHPTNYLLEFKECWLRSLSSCFETLLWEVNKFKPGHGHCSLGKRTVNRKDCLTKSSSSLLSLQHHKHGWQPLSKGGGILNESGFLLPSSLRIT